MVITTNSSALSRQFGFSSILTDNYKLSKVVADSSIDYDAKALMLPPHNKSGKNFCAAADACVHSCVTWFSGRTNSASYRKAAMNRAKLFIEDREAFGKVLLAGLRKHVDQCERHGKQACFRPNGSSDLPFELLYPKVFAEFGDSLLCYDYTKIRSRIYRAIAGTMPENYSLTYSVNEHSDMSEVRYFLESGINCAIVVDAEYVPSIDYKGPIPKTMTIAEKRFRCVDGDSHDIRIPSLDGSGKLILLRHKGGRVSCLESVQLGFTKRVRGGVASLYELVLAA